MVDSRQKGARAELQVRDKLRSLTGLNWERVPGSGALDEKHGLKGDLYVPNKKNEFCVEVKSYKEDNLNSRFLHNKSPIKEWWSQAVRQGKQVNKLPLLIYKFNRSKMYACVGADAFFELVDCEPCMYIANCGLETDIIIIELERIIPYLEFIE